MSVYNDSYGTPEEQARDQRKIADLLRAEEDHDLYDEVVVKPAQAIRTLQEDLRRAVEDRRKLLVVMGAIYNAAWQGMEENPGRDGYALFSRIADEAAKIKSQVEGT